MSGDCPAMLLDDRTYKQKAEAACCSAQPRRELPSWSLEVLLEARFGFLYRSVIECLIVIGVTPCRK
jgi:hypothetical protein